MSQKSSSSEMSFEDIGVSLPDEHLIPHQKQEASGLLDKWKHIFSTCPTDLGFTNLVKHEIIFRTILHLRTRIDVFLQQCLRRYVNI